MPHLHFDQPRPAGSNADPYQAQLLDEDGAPVNITGASSVVFKMFNPRTGTYAVTAGAGSIVSATDGTVSYQPSTTEVGTDGTYECEFTVTLASGRVIRTPKIIETITAAV
jgi:hypothetical protein